MAGYLSRSVSLSPIEPNPPSQPGQTQNKQNSNSEQRRMQEVVISPLKIFVLAKKKINDVFVGIRDYVDESYDFLVELGPHGSVVSSQHIQDVAQFKEKVSGIREVLARDHMKVAFFGRTSNGKSSVINAMLQDKILPSGLGHTTNCFLQVEGSDTSEAYLMTEDSVEKKNVQSVAQLAHALNSENLGESTLVRIFWPKDRCPLLRDDVVLVDSPGIDVSPNLDEWIDKHCLDADVFVLVANAESTLMLTEKNFFHKVSERLSKPNIFILNNRWDASASEPEFLDKVRKQHMDRNVSFLVDELKVVSRQQAEDRVFFVSAKEVLQARLQQQKGLPPHKGASMIEGFQNRFFEFQDFERKFEECLSKAAVKTKFEQHTQQGKAITNNLWAIMDSVYEGANDLKKQRLMQRKELWDKLDFTEQQLNLLTDEIKHQIGQLVELVEQKVASALSEEIQKLAVLVNEFERPFHPDSLVTSVYKKEMNAHIESGLGSNMRGRLSSTLASLVESSQGKMIERISTLLPQEHRQQMMNVLPRHNFEVLYRLNCESLCSDFQEDLEFRFSLGLTNMMRRFLGIQQTKATLNQFRNISRPIPTTPQTPSNEIKPLPQVNPDYLALVQKIALVSPSSQTAVGALAIGGLLVRTVGWRVIAVSFGVYGLLYLYERLTWTNKAKERAFKKQYVNHATRKLRLIVDLTSANCSHQVQQELSSTFARLGHLVDEVISDMRIEVKDLDNDIEKLDKSGTAARIFRNKAGYLGSELETFSQQYLQYEQ
ncbi:mitofusin-2-like [Centruroides sculpturatus]|uniref:mitofusin-2-like n=1 Tax=Centruroides sculpturatus TaxID=218467 RepID=UPI000C6D98BC|nr:mitofusin-2-like [Centruroides sculpturatus]